MNITGLMGLVWTDGITQMVRNNSNNYATTKITL